MIDRRRLLVLAGSSLAAASALSQTFAQGSYPTKSIRLVIPRTPGGSVDVIGRAWSEKVRNTLGASHVENVGGGGGRIGADAVARAPADGYTLLIGTTSELVLNPLLAKQNYDPVKDFAPIGFLSTSPLIIGLHPDVPANNLKELAEFMKANPDRANFGTAGANTIGHIAGEMFKRIAALPKLVHIPYKGGAAAMQDVMGGRLAFGIVSISGSVVDLHEAGKLKIIAVTSSERLEAAPKDSFGDGARLQGHGHRIFHRVICADRRAAGDHVQARELDDRRDEGAVAAQAAAGCWLRDLPRPTAKRRQPS